MLAEMTAQGWRWGLGDPSPMGYATTLLYVVAAYACWRAATRPPALPAELVRRHGQFWVVLAVVMFALAINKQGDLQSLLTYWGRGVARFQGWYEERQAVQRWFILGVTAVGCATLLGLAWSIRRLGPACWLALAGICLQLVFVLVRAASFHHVDKLLGFPVAGIRANWLLECTGIICVAGAAWWSGSGHRPVGRRLAQGLGGQRRGSATPESGSRQGYNARR